MNDPWARANDVRDGEVEMPVELSANKTALLVGEGDLVILRANRPLSDDHAQWIRRMWTAQTPRTPMVLLDAGVEVQVLRQTRFTPWLRIGEPIVDGTASRLAAVLVMPEVLFGGAHRAPPLPEGCRLVALRSDLHRGMIELLFTGPELPKVTAPDEPPRASWCVEAGHKEGVPFVGRSFLTL